MSNILMNRTRSQIIRFLLRNGPASCSEIGSELRISSSAIRRHLALMHRAGLLESSDSLGYSASPQTVRAAAEAFSATLCSGSLPQTPRMPVN
ncbi:ArsR/SmtB family transcription factor [Arthrobacter bambusae]|uniref:ArsR/SmtB family transcription factor n=1 Tax=Arthrobacter bambusae TaxID=1338426 RepID=UPI00351FCDDA